MESISLEQADIIGEIANICIGTAATALSMIINRPTNITTPKVEVLTKEALLGNDDTILIKVPEAMNQMCGSIATSMASLLRQPTDIGFPLINCTEQKTFEIPEELCNGNDIVKVSFRLIVDDIIDSRLVQLYPVSIVKQILKQEEI